MLVTKTIEWLSQVQKVSVEFLYSATFESRRPGLAGLVRLDLKIKSKSFIRRLMVMRVS